jgi:hypothetical protein
MQKLPTGALHFTWKQEDLAKAYAFLANGYMTTLIATIHSIARPSLTAYNSGASTTRRHMVIQQRRNGNAMGDYKHGWMQHGRQALIGWNKSTGSEGAAFFARVRTHLASS